MPSKNSGQRLRDILENLDAIQTFTAGIGFAAFIADRKTLYAVTRALEIISEASRRLPDDLKVGIPRSIGLRLSWNMKLDDVVGASSASSRLRSPHATGCGRPWL